jgi:Sigma-70 region 2
MTTPIPSALQSLFAKRGFAWSDEIAGRQLPSPTDADATRRIAVLDDVAAPTAEIDVSTSDDPSSLFTAISPLGDNERQRLFESLEDAEHDLVDALLAAYDRETWPTSKLCEDVASNDEVDWDTIAEFRRDGRGARAVLGRQLAEAMDRDERAPPAALRSARTLLEIRARLFRDSVRIAISMAKARAHDLDKVVALSTACMGLLIAIDRFEPSRGYKFSTYAVWWIRHRVSRTRQDDARPLRVPVHVTERVTRFLRAERELWAKIGRPADAQEVAALGHAHRVWP